MPIHLMATTCAVIACLIATPLASTASAQEQNLPSAGTSSPPPATAVSAPRLIVADDVLAPLNSSGAIASAARRGTPAFAVIDAGSFAEASQFRRRARGRHS